MRPSTSALHALAFLFILATLCGKGIAQVEPDEVPEFTPAQTDVSAPSVSQDLIARNIGGLPILRCTIRFQKYAIEAHLMFDVSLVEPFRIHESSLGGLGLNSAIAKTQKVDIAFGNGIELKGIPIETERYPLLETHTKLHAAALNEVPVVGFIGPAAFNSNVIELDMAKELLRTMGIATDQAQAQEMPYELMDCGIVVKGIGPAASPVRAVVSTQIYDSGLAPSLLKLARDRGTKPNILKIGEVDWGDRSALRFDPLDETWPQTVNGVIGADALSNAIVTLWPKRKMIALRPGVSSPFPDQEQQYFLALADRNPDGVAKFIEGGARRRLLDEACLNLWTIRLEDPKSSMADLKTALETVAAKYSAERCSETILNLADALEQSRHEHREELVEHALQLAIRESSAAVKQTAIHDVHVRIGRRAFAKGDINQARRHLLSAAFGMPKNAECNFWLGEVYQKTGKLRRAWSRYFQALLDEKLDKDDPLRAQALERLTALNRDPEFRKDFNMTDAEEYMAGRLANSEFHAETRYRFVRNRQPHHARMAELFVDSSQKLGGGMELAFQALAEFFEDEVVLVSWHLDDPMHSEAARQRLAFYQKKSAPLAVIDGKLKFDTALGKGEKPAEDAALHYPLLRDACLPETAPESAEWEIGGNINADGDRLKLGVSVDGGESPDGLRLVVALCERSVMAVEKNGVFFHHFVARDFLTPADGLALDKVLKEPLELAIDVADLRKRAATALPERYRSATKDGAPYIDPNQLFAVAFVQRSGDSAILAAKTFRLPESP